MKNRLVKVAIVGPESSGKTFLAQMLSRHFGCAWVPEFAREYLENLSRPYTQTDVEKIAAGQLKAEDDALRNSKKLLICDTNLLVIKIWMQHKYQIVPGWIEEEIKKRFYDIHFLTAPDIPYENDPLRENPELGEYFFQKYKEKLEALKLKHIIISGNKKERMKTASLAVNELL